MILKRSTYNKMKSDLASEYERANRAEETLLDYLIEDRKRAMRDGRGYIESPNKDKDS